MTAPITSIKVEWTGAKELAAQMAGLARDAADHLAFRAVYGAAENSRVAAIENVVNEGLVESGALVHNVAIVRKPVAGLTFSYDLGVRHGAITQIHEDDDPYYWFMLEFGTVKRPKGTPFITPAIEQNKEKSLSIMQAVVTRGIARYLAKVSF